VFIDIDGTVRRPGVCLFRLMAPTVGAGAKTGRNTGLNNDRFRREKLCEEPAPRSALGAQRAVITTGRIYLSIIKWVMRWTP
jgi:hypothetical protein